ncbi:polysaccharide lyase [Reichenbachiella ulvae]|uniref:Polysaccharide lyase 14 domain-containing protein n=1 Tax=Reichenbachiella ulvae TaxID=2980104 RepID=A0ABT3CXE0_9BACT|nr:hypothetical protein [Reichenbachiella ulvae]MCV9388370.1 hypothetical protein [Reichenbachiella ulvae]
MKKIFLLSMLMGSMISSQTQIIYNQSFENWNHGDSYTSAHLKKDGFSFDWTAGFDESRVIVDSTQAHTGKFSIRVKYPKDAVGPSQGGAQVPLNFEGKKEVYISYWLYFSDNFDWGGKHEGGKLPGLATGDNCSGGQTCDGTNGFTARLMWRKGGEAVLYLYHMDKPGKYGEDIPLMNGEQQVVFEKGQWYQVTERVKINSDNNKDGEVEIWINRNPALLKTGIQFVNDGSLIDNFYISTFHGGADIEWAPGEDCYIWMDDWIVSTDKADVL